MWKQTSEKVSCRYLSTPTICTQTLPRQIIKSFAVSKSITSLWKCFAKPTSYHATTRLSSWNSRCDFCQCNNSNESPTRQLKKIIPLHGISIVTQFLNIQYITPTITKTPFAIINTYRQNFRNGNLVLIAVKQYLF